MEGHVDELEALLEYLIKHNADHAGEIEELAARAETLGNSAAHEHLLVGVAKLKDSNESLKAALLALRGGDVSL
jgi:hypothetical protein